MGVVTADAMQNPCARGFSEELYGAGDPFHHVVELNIARHICV